MQKDNDKNINKINFKGQINFNGPTQFANGDIVNNDSFNSSSLNAIYDPEIKWRTPFTKSVLTWGSIITGIVDFFSFIKAIEELINFFNIGANPIMVFGFPFYLILFILLLFLCLFLGKLIKITVNQTRHPLFLNFAISGIDNRITLEKIHINKCPRCGGKMKYYNKPTAWRKVVNSYGSRRRYVTERTPVLECKRNKKHCYEVDPAENKIK